LPKNPLKYFIYFFIESSSCKTWLKKVHRKWTYDDDHAAAGATILCEFWLAHSFKDSFPPHLISNNLKEFFEMGERIFLFFFFWVAEGNQIWNGIE
jgi:hypothetical protein